MLKEKIIKYVENKEKLVKRKFTKKELFEKFDRDCH